MKTCSRILLLALAGLTPFFHARAAELPAAKTPAEIFSTALSKWVGLLDPEPGAEPKTFSTTLELTKADGLPKGFAGQSATLAIPTKPLPTGSPNDANTIGMLWVSCRTISVT